MRSGLDRVLNGWGPLTGSFDLLLQRRIARIEILPVLPGAGGSYSHGRKNEKPLVVSDRSGA